jgi:hypothetical protein
MNISIRIPQQEARFPRQPLPMSATYLIRSESLVVELRGLAASLSIVVVDEHQPHIVGQEVGAGPCKHPVTNPKWIQRSGPPSRSGDARSRSLAFKHCFICYLCISTPLGIF